MAQVVESLSLGSLASWRHQMETFSALLALCEGHRWIPLTEASDARNFDAFFDLRLNKWLSKQSRRRWFLRLLWRHSNVGTDFPTKEMLLLYFFEICAKFQSDS